MKDRCRDSIIALENAEKRLKTLRKKGNLKEYEKQLDYVKDLRKISNKTCR